MKRLALNLVLFSLATIGAEARAECVSIVFYHWSSTPTAYEYPQSMTYDTSAGVTVQMVRGVGSPTFYYTARLPKLVGGQPNPDFDRVYGLLLKAFPLRQIGTICVAGTASSGATLDITSISMRDAEEGIPVTVVNQPKVSVCDTWGTCASVTYNKELNTSK